MKVALRKYSFMNPWIDFTVVIDQEDICTVERLLRKAYDAYWDFQYETYGDAVTETLYRYGIEYEFCAQNPDIDEDPDYEAWFDDLQITKDMSVWKGETKK